MNAPAPGLIPLLLADPSPCLRPRVLRELLGAGEENAEVVELSGQRASDPLVKELVDLQDASGAWKRSDLPGATQDSLILGTSQALLRLGLMGFGPRDPIVQRAASFLFACQNKNGSWPLVQGGDDQEEHGYSTISLQTALPLRGLALCGYASHPQAETAYTWLLSQRLADGAWPTGYASGILRNVGGYRRLAHSRWGCRSNTTGALECLSLHPVYRHSPEAQRGLDLLLGRETREAYTLGFETARQLGAEPARGLLTYFARFDLAQVLGLCARIGASPDDERVAALGRFIIGLQGIYGLWTYHPQPQVARWVTLELLLSLGKLDQPSDWLSQEPHTPFQSYPRRNKRY